MKKCLGKYSCGVEKPLEEFYKNKKGHYSSLCKECDKKRARENYHKNVDKRKQQHKEWVEKNKDHVKEKNKQWKEKNQSYLNEYMREWNKNNPEKRSVYSKRWRDNNIKKALEYSSYWYYNNKEQKNEKQKEWNKKKRKNDPCFKLRQNVSRAVNSYLKLNNGSKKGDSFLKFLPYSSEELREHLEALWEPWMNWDNYGQVSLIQQTWQIDHIIPQSKLPYDSLDHPNFLKCWSLENLRPLEAKQNIRKSNKVL